MKKVDFPRAGKPTKIITSWGGGCDGMMGGASAGLVTKNGSQDEFRARQALDSQGLSEDTWNPGMVYAAGAALIKYS